MLLANENSETTAVRVFMRSLLVRILVLLLSLAPVSGNGNTRAVPQPHPAHAELCPEEHARHTGTTTTDDEHRQECRCDCLDCGPAGQLPPRVNVIPAEFVAEADYDALTTSLSGRTLLPEPAPPRPGALS